MTCIALEWQPTSEIKLIRGKQTTIHVNSVPPILVWPANYLECAEMKAKQPISH